MHRVGEGHRGDVARGAVGGETGVARPAQGGATAGAGIAVRLQGDDRAVQVGVAQPLVQRAVPARGHPPDRAVLAVGERAVATVDTGHDHPVQVGLHLGAADGVQALAVAHPGPVDVRRDDDHRAHEVGGDEHVHLVGDGARGEPVRRVPGGAVEQVDHRVARGGVLRVAGRGVHPRLRGRDALAGRGRDGDGAHRGRRGGGGDRETARQGGDLHLQRPRARRTSTTSTATSATVTAAETTAGHQPPSQSVVAHSRSRTARDRWTAVPGGVMGGGCARESEATMRAARER